MALIRAEVRNRLGDSSIYDCIVESLQDFSTEPMLDHVHTGSIALCLNLDSQNGNDSEEQSAPVCYIKSSDGSWKQGSVLSAHLMNLMESLIAQKIMGMTGGSCGGGDTPAPPAGTDVNCGQFTLATDTYAPDPIAVQTDWDHLVIWTEESFLVGRRNINGAVIWKKSNSTLAYKVMYTDTYGTSGEISYLPNGGTLYSLDANNSNTLCFSSDSSFGVYVGGVTYKWAAWKEGA